MFSFFGVLPTTYLSTSLQLFIAYDRHVVAFFILIPRKIMGLLRRS
jgi:hypothetical protein